MFYALTGTISGYDESRLFLKSGNIEWELEVSERCLQHCISIKDSQLRLFTHLYVREDIIRLYGFESELERSTFLQLTSVNMVGPKLALRILSRLSGTEIWEALSKEDVATLMAVQGLGKKNAEKIILTLKDRAQNYYSPADSQEPPLNSSARQEDLLAALLAMGYERQQALRVLRKHLHLDDDAEVLRQSIALLSDTVGE